MGLEDIVKLFNLKDQIENLVSKSTPDSIIFNVHEVKNAIFSLKNGKKEESGLDTDHFINGPNRLFVIICTLFNSMIIHGIAPSDFLIGTMIPIVKDYRKSSKRSDNYRTLTLHTPPEAFFGFKKKNEETEHTPCTVKFYRLQK